MMLLDTNVLSEFLLARPNEAVLDWFSGQAMGDLHTSSVTVAEMVYGLRIMPEGQRREGLEARFEAFIHEAFSGRILGFDEAAARTYGGIMASRRSLGRPMTVPDGQIAAIARVHGLRLVTRNIRDFEGVGLDLVDPFAGP
jgi:hypothetical protein